MSFPQILLMNIICICLLNFWSSNVWCQEREVNKSARTSGTLVSSTKQSQHSKSFDQLMVQLLNKDVDIRYSAAKVLGELMLKQVEVEHLLHAVRVYASNTTRKRISTALPEIKNKAPAVIDLLNRSLTEEDLPVVAGAYSYYIGNLSQESKDREQIIRTLIKAFYAYSDSAMVKAFRESGCEELIRASMVWDGYQSRFAESSNAEQFMAVYFEADQAGMNLREGAGKALAKKGMKAAEDLAVMVNEQHRTVRFRTQAVYVLEDTLE